MLMVLVRVNFPGAVNSKFTNELAFQTPSTHEAIPTYRIMDSDGVVVDEARGPKDVTDAEAVNLYKDMLTGTRPSLPFSTSFFRVWGADGADVVPSSQYHGYDHV